jgi:hypothetical protein
MTAAAIVAAGSVAVMAQEAGLPGLPDLETGTVIPEIRGGVVAPEFQALEGALLPPEIPEAPEPGLRFTIDVNAGFTFDTNEDLTNPSEGDSTRTNIGADFGLVSETDVSRLALALLAEARYGTGPGPDDGLEFRIPLATLGYERDGFDSFANLNGRYFYDNVDDDVLIFLDEDLNPVDLIVDGGDLRRWTFDGRVGFGAAAPIGAEAGFFFDSREYIDTTDPDLYNRAEWGVDGNVNFQITPTFRGRFIAAYSTLDEDDVGDTLTDTTDLGFGGTYDIDAATVFDGNIAYTNIEQTTFDSFTTTTEGWIFDFSLQREVTNGTIGGALERTLTEAAERTQLTFDRAMELPAGELDYTLGASFSETGGETRFIGSITYEQELPTGSFSVSANQNTVTSDDEEDTLVTQVLVLYNHDINSVSSVGVNFGLGRSENIGGGASDPNIRGNAGISYRRALTQDWDWVLGYERQYSSEDGGDAATGNQVYTLIDRSFSIRP